MSLISRLSAVLIVLCSSAQAQQYNFERLAADIFSIEFKSSKIAITTDSKSSGLSTSNAKAIEEAVSTAIQRKAASQSHSVIAASELSKVYDYKQFTGDRSDFSDLAEKLKADLLITVSIQKLTPKSAQVSAKLLGVSGTDQGKILNASKVYEIPINTVVKIVVEGVFDQNNERKDKLDDNVLIGFSSEKAINIVKTPKSKNDVDYFIRADISFSIEDVKTKEAEGAEMFSSLISGMADAMKGDKDPTGRKFADGMAGGLKNKGKTKVVTVIAKMTATEADGKKTLTEHIESKTLPSEVSDDQLRSEIGKAAKISLKSAAESMAKKLLDDPSGSSTKSKSKSMFD
jgi:hypothetical protein